MKTLELLKKNDTGICLAKELFLERFSFPLGANRVVRMEYHRIQQSDNRKMRVPYILLVITGRYRNILDFGEGRLCTFSERLTVGDMLA